MDSFTKAFTKVAAREYTGGRVSKENSQNKNIFASLVSFEEWA